MNTNTKPGERPQILGPTELVQALREKHAGGWRLSYRAAMRVVQEQYDFRRAAALSSPHPEALEGVIDALDFASQIETALANGAWKHTELANRIEMYVESRLAAQKDEGQAFTVEQVGWLRVVLGRALYRVEHFPEQSNDEGIEADELAKAIILLGGEPATPEPRLAAQKDEGPSNNPETPDGSPRDCDTCRHWGGWSKNCGFCHNRSKWEGRSAPKPAPVVSHDAADTIHNAGSVSHDNREPDGRKGEGMREAVRDVIDRAITGYDTCHGKKHYAYTIDGEQAYLIDSNQMAALVRALRESDGRKGE